MQRYLSGRSVTESRLGLLFNGMFKVPMQFVILFIGVMVFVFYLFTQPPLFFNRAELERVRQPTRPRWRAARPRSARLFAEQRRAIDAWMRRPREPRARSRAAESADAGAAQGDQGAGGPGASRRRPQRTRTTCSSASCCATCRAGSSGC